MRNSTEYKTAFGLYKATIKCLDRLEGMKKAWWLHNAIYNAEHVMKDEVLVKQLRDLIKRAAPRTFNDLKVIC